jgi:hypothetical protein
MKTATLETSPARKTAQAPAARVAPADVENAVETFLQLVAEAEAARVEAETAEATAKAAANNLEELGAIDDPLELVRKQEAARLARMRAKAGEAQARGRFGPMLHAWQRAHTAEAARILDALRAEARRHMEAQLRPIFADRWEEAARAHPLAHALTQAEAVANSIPKLSFMSAAGGTRYDLAYCESLGSAVRKVADIRAGLARLCAFTLPR